MMLARSRIDPHPHDPMYGYRDLARYVQDGFKEPFDRTDLYLRLLAAAKAERTALPTLTHMQALMSMVWESDMIPAKYETEFQSVCHHISETLCFDIGKYATESMKALAQTLRVELNVQMGYEQDESPKMEVSQEAPAKEETQTMPLTGKPTIH
jgi:hypothetical protein